MLTGISALATPTPTQLKESDASYVPLSFLDAFPLEESLLSAAEEAPEGMLHRPKRKAQATQGQQEWRRHLL